MIVNQPGKILLKGALFSLPFLLTFIVVIWLIKTTDSLLSKPLFLILPEDMHIPGIGIVLAILLFYGVGLIIHNRILDVLLNGLEHLMEKLPLVSVVYQNIKEMIEFMSGEKEDDLEQVVMVSINGDIEVMGFITQDHPETISSNKQDNDIVAVYLPMSYQMGGYLIYVSKDNIRPLDIPKSEALQRILTADLAKKSSA